MKKFFVPLLVLSACATATLVNVHKKAIYVDAGTGDLPTGYYDITCEEYYTENDTSASIAAGANVRPNYYSARCTVKIEGRRYQCFWENYDVDPINQSVMELACSSFISNWTRPVEENDGGYSPPGH